MEEDDDNDDDNDNGAMAKASALTNVAIARNAAAALALMMSNDGFNARPCVVTWTDVVGWKVREKKQTLAPKTSFREIPPRRDIYASGNLGRCLMNRIIAHRIRFNNHECLGEPCYIASSPR